MLIAMNVACSIRMEHGGTWSPSPKLGAKPTTYRGSCLLHTYRLHTYGADQGQGFLAPYVCSEATSQVRTRATSWPPLYTYRAWWRTRNAVREVVATCAQALHACVTDGLLVGEVAPYVCSAPTSAPGRVAHSIRMEQGGAWSPSPKIGANSTECRDPCLLHTYGYDRGQGRPSPYVCSAPASPFLVRATRWSPLHTYGAHRRSRDVVREVVVVCVGATCVRSRWVLGSKGATPYVWSACAPAAARVSRHEVAAHGRCGRRLHTYVRRRPPDAAAPRTPVNLGFRLFGLWFGGLVMA